MNRLSLNLLEQVVYDSSLLSQCISVAGESVELDCHLPDSPPPSRITWLSEVSPGLRPAGYLHPLQRHTGGERVVHLWTLDNVLCCKVSI